MSAQTRTLVEDRPSHRLAPITPSEIALAVELVRASGHLGKRGWFETVTLDEPAKGDDPGKRQAFVCGYDPERQATM